MSYLAKLVRNSSRLPLRQQANKLKPVDNQDRVRKWVGTMTSKAVSNESKQAVVQLSSVINFLNRPTPTEDVTEIDWNHWRNELFTEGLVDKVKKNYESLVSEDYNFENVITQIVSTPSKELEDITNELFFHGAVWMNAYSDYSMFLYELADYGNPNDYLMHENYDFFYGLEAELEELVETHNYIPGSKDDVNLRGYYAAQFNWGKKVISFYRHPADDFKAGRATKNILGR